MGLSQYWDLFLLNLHGTSLWVFALVVFFMLLNWGLEAAKWRLLIHKIEDISFMRSFQAIMSGVTLAIFTPNRIGEYGGRIFYLEKADRIMGIAVTLIGSYAQIAVTLVLGLIGMQLYAIYFTDLEGYMLLTTFSVAWLLILLVLISYFNIKLVYRIVHRIPFMKKARKYIRIFYRYDFQELLKVILLSLLRYGVFTAQYILLLYAFGIKIALIPAITMVTMIFLTQMVIPSITLTELGIRGNIAIYFFEILTENLVGILAASFSLWLINLIIPAVIGFILILRVNFLSTRKA